MWFRSLEGNKHARCCCCLPVRQSNILSLLETAIISTGPSRGTPAPPGLWATPGEGLLGFMRPLSQSGHTQSQCPHHTDGERHKAAETELRDKHSAALLAALWGCTQWCYKLTSCCSYLIKSWSWFKKHHCSEFPLSSSDSFLHEHLIKM